MECSGRNVIGSRVKQRGDHSRCRAYSNQGLFPAQRKWSLACIDLTVQRALTKIKLALRTTKWTTFVMLTVVPPVGTKQLVQGHVLTDCPLYM